MRLALFGGTFDPVHTAHLTVARDNHPRAAGGDLYRLHRRELAEADTTRVDGIPVTTAARTIRKNLQILEINEGAEVIERDAAVALRMLDSQAVACDFVFLDPPYRKMGDYEQVLGFLSQSQLLAPESQVIAEHDKHFDPGNEFGALRRHRTLRQGDAVLSFYRR